MSPEEILAAAAFTKEAKYDPEYNDYYDGFPNWNNITNSIWKEDDPVLFEYNGEKHFVQLVDSYGGEGMGDEYWFIYEVDGKTYKLDGSWVSWDGPYLDDAEFYQVKPVEVKVTKWVKA